MAANARCTPRLGKQTTPPQLGRRPLLPERLRRRSRYFVDRKLPLPAAGLVDLCVVVMFHNKIYFYSIPRCRPFLWAHSRECMGRPEAAPLRERAQSPGPLMCRSSQASRYFISTIIAAGRTATLRRSLYLHYIYQSRFYWFLLILISICALGVCIIFLVLVRNTIRLGA